MIINQDGNEIQNVENFIGDDRVIIYADSSRNQEALNTFLKGKVDYICDKNENKKGQLSNGIEIISLEQLYTLENQFVLFTVISDLGFVNNLARKCGIKKIMFDIRENVYDKYVNHFVKSDLWLAQNQKIVDNQKSYKYIEFIPDEKFVLPIYHMLSDHYNISEHLFIIHSVNYTNVNDFYRIWKIYDEFNEKNLNCFLLDDGFNFRRNDCVSMLSQLTKKFEQAQSIIFHSGQLSDSIGEFFDAHLDWIKEKGKLLLWGAERDYDPGYRFYQSFLQWIPEVWGAEKDKDNEIFIKNYQFKNFSFHADARIGYDYISCPKHNSLRKQDTTLNIMVGHSGSEYLDHKDALCKLAKYKEEKIKIYCLLSYDNNDKKRMKEIKEYGRELFGEKFIVVDNYMSEKEYIDFLSDMDVVIMPMRKRVGYTSCRSILRLGKKMFVYRYAEILTELYEMGIQCYEIDSIPMLNFDDFLANPAQEKNLELARKYLDKTHIFWKKIYCE